MPTSTARGRASSEVEVAFERAAMRFVAAPCFVAPVSDTFRLIRSAIPHSTSQVAGYQLA